MAEKRTWVYVMPPRVYGMAPCKCGNQDTQWSEFAKHLWCDKCQTDFIPEHNGIFDGPISVGVAKVLGVKFDKIDLMSEKLIRFDIETGRYEDEV